jgi:hypothetical protein
VDQRGADGECSAGNCSAALAVLRQNPTRPVDAYTVSVGVCCTLLLVLKGHAMLAALLQRNPNHSRHDTPRNVRRIWSAGHASMHFAASPDICFRTHTAAVRFALPPAAQGDAATRHRLTHTSCDNMHALLQLLLNPGYSAVPQLC